MTSDTPTLSLQDIRESIEDYLTTILALQAFVSLVTWDGQNSSVLPHSNYSFGRRMHTSPENRVSPGETVTPDAVIQKDEALGYLVEAKKSLPSNHDYWSSVLQQLLKYDDDLQGWWTDDEHLSDPNVLLLVHMSRAVDFTAYIQGAIDRGEAHFVRPTSIVEFTKSSELKEFVFIRKQWGAIQDEAFSAVLESGKSIPIEKMLGTYGSIKFYDAEPVVEHTMVILWQDIFTPMKSDFPYDEEKSTWIIEVTTDELTDQLQTIYGDSGISDRDVPFPRKSWVTRAMDALVALGYVEKGQEAGQYVVLFRRITGDVLERFARHREPGGQTAADEEPLQTSFL